MVPFLISLLLSLLIVGVLVWGIRTILPLLGLPAEANKVINVVLVVLVVLWLASAVLGYAPLVPVRRWD